MRAARNFTYGKGEHKPDGTPRNRAYAMGDDVPKEVADDIPDDLILEKVAKSDPDSLSRQQLLLLAGITDDEVGEPIEYDESDLRDALSNLRTKTDVLDWLNQVRPSQQVITDIEDQDRAEMVDLIIEEMTGE